MKKTFRAATFAFSLLITSGALAQEAVVDSMQTERGSAPARAPMGDVPLSGSVRDAKTGRNLDYTNIIFYHYVDGTEGTEQHSGTIAISDGQFYHRLPAGRYEAVFLYLGYEKYTSVPFEVKPGEPIRLDVQLKVKPIKMHTYTVQGQKIRNTEFASLVEKKKAVALQESITSEQISKGTDSDAAEALERVTGLSVVGGKYVYVRGLGDRYSSTSLNGASLSSPEPSRRTVPLDIFPAAMLDNIVVQKTFTPDMEGEFGGGNIDVQTRAAVDKRQFSQKLSFGYAQNVLDMGTMSYRGGDWDFLGIDDGTRGLPGSLDPYSNSKLPGPLNILGDGLERSELGRIRKSFSNVWTPRRGGEATNVSYSGMLADGFELFGRKGSYLAATSLSNSYNTKQFEQLDIRGGSGGSYNARTRFDKTTSTRATLLGLTGAVNFQPTQGSSVGYNVLYTRSSDDDALVSEGVNDQSQLVRQTVLDYVERELFAQSLQGNHYWLNSTAKINWILSYSEAQRDRPDNRFAEFKWDTVDVITDPDDPEEILELVKGWAKSPLGYPFQRSFSLSDEDDRGGKISWKQDLPRISFLEQNLSVGYSYRERNRSTVYRNFGIACRGCDYDGSGQAERVFSPDTYDDPSFLDELVITELTDPKDSYDASQRTLAGYSMLDLDIAKTVRLVGGARYESSRQDVVAGTIFESEDQLTASLDTDDILPAVNTTWRVNDAINFRSSYSRTLNRPEMRELAPLRLFNFETGIEEQGNRFLDQAQIDSYDVRLEFFPGLRRYMSASVFHKEIERPIERVLVAQAAGNLKEVPGNGESGKIQGFELEWRGGVTDAAGELGQLGASGAWLATRPFWALGKVPGLGAIGRLGLSHARVGAPDVPQLRNWGMVFNFSRIESEVEINTARITNEAILTVSPDANVVDGNIMRKAPLTGQSTYAFNGGLLYGDGRRDFSLMVKAFGDRLQSFGVGSPDLYEKVPTVLDAAISQKFGDRIKLKFAVENILDERRDTYYAAESGDTFTGVDGEEIFDPVRISTLDGRKFGLSISYAP